VKGKSHSKRSRFDQKDSTREAVSRMTLSAPGESVDVVELDCDSGIRIENTHLCARYKIHFCMHHYSDPSSMTAQWPREKNTTVSDFSGAGHS